MKHFITLITVIALLSCNRNKTLVDLSNPIGDTLSYYSEDEMDSVYYVVKDTVIRRDTIFSLTERLECKEYKELKDIIHRGEVCALHNSAALAIAKSKGYKERVTELEEQNQKAEEDGRAAADKLVLHLRECKVCRKIKNQF